MYSWVIYYMKDKEARVLRFRSGVINSWQEINQHVMNLEDANMPVTRVERIKHVL